MKEIGSSYYVHWTSTKARLSHQQPAASITQKPMPSVITDAEVCHVDQLVSMVLLQLYG